MSKSRVHCVVLTLAFNRPVSPSAALRAARNRLIDVHGATIAEEETDGWQRMRTRAAKLARADRPKPA